MLQGTSQGRRTQARFAETSWTLVLEAQAGDGSRARAALADLCARYWPPVYAFLRQKGLARWDAEDRAQDFFAVLLRREGFASVNPAAGRFRSWLLAALENFLVDAHRRTRTLKRGRDYVHLAPEEVGELERSLAEVSARPEDATCRFERAWADAVVRQTLARLRADYAARGKLALCAQLEPAILGEMPAGELAAAAQKLDLRPETVRQAVSRLRRRFREQFRAEVARTVATEAEVEGEMRYLLAAWEEA